MKLDSPGLQAADDGTIRRESGVPDRDFLLCESIDRVSYTFIWHRGAPRFDMRIHASVSSPITSTATPVTASASKQEQ